MAKKVKLPFVVEPKREPVMHRIGNEESGVIEIERKGYLTVAEKSFMQQAQAGDMSVLSMHRLAGRIAKKAGLQQSEVIAKFGSGELTDPIFEDFEEELVEVVGDMTSFDSRRRMLSAACLLMFRFDADWEISQTMELHPELIDGLYELYVLEDLRSLEGFASDESVAGPDTEGK